MLNITFHLTKAFGTVCRDGLSSWSIMDVHCNVRQFHDGMLDHLQDHGDYSGLFNVTNGVKQECVLACTLFSMMFAAMLMDAFKDNSAGVKVHFHIHISNLMLP